ncbi:hypothetical protein PROFUN_08564 [Planoprotostelium fungivorum]|uniref:Leucine-rich repeat-containing N-terminal plant-type domain-containing protein n=1 Tax=Planoprotostelium fungivorum TaxID=1890364 RepID=A0A2P6N1T9_9EUKA|nr:hypothetical protein PROFUN_08564 [Planoprotostelium fungivorum]
MDNSCQEGEARLILPPSHVKRQVPSTGSSDTATQLCSVLLYLALLSGLAFNAEGDTLDVLRAVWTSLNGETCNGVLALTIFEGSRNLWVGTDYCNGTDFLGITCDSSRRVTGLSLDSLPSTGTLNPLINNLTSLSYLRIVNCQLTGSIPDFSGTALTRLELSHNELSGPLPDSICNATSLITVYLHVNALSGPIPPCISRLKSLTDLWLGVNYHSPYTLHHG